VEWPAGLELRPFERERHGRLVQAAIDEAFTNEWGDELRDHETWSQRVFGVEQFDPRLWLVVWDPDEVAAVCLDCPKRLGDRGRIATMAARPRRQRQGLGLALLRGSFGRFAERGETAAALGADSENPAGAARNHESLVLN